MQDDGETERAIPPLVLNQIPEILVPFITGGQRPCDNMPSSTSRSRWRHVTLTENPTKLYVIV